MFGLIFGSLAPVSEFRPSNVPNPVLAFEAGRSTELVAQGFPEGFATARTLDWDRRDFIDGVHDDLVVVLDFGHLELTPILPSGLSTRAAVLVHQRRCGFEPALVTAVGFSVWD